MTLVPASAETIFHIGSFPITNAIINSWIAVIFFVLIVYFLQKKSDLVPRGLQNLVEGIIEFMLSEINKITNDNKKTKAFLPIVGTIFVFILFSNWFGLMPGTGSIGFWHTHAGHRELIPFLRSSASDLNLTLAIALFAVASSHYYGLKQLGAVKHISKFINFRGIFKAFSKGPMEVVTAIIEFGVGLIEIISEFAKVLSLSLRLFGNVFAGEVLMTVMLGLFSFFLPIPFIFLEILVGIIQATVFAMLTLAYLTVATIDHEDHDEKNEKQSTEEKMELVV